MSCDCIDSTELDGASADPLYRDISVDLGQGDAREFAPNNWVIQPHGPIFRNPMGGPAETPAPSGMNDRVTPIIEARSFDVAPWFLTAPEGGLDLPAYLDESALYLDEGYIGGNVQELT